MKKSFLISIILKITVILSSSVGILICISDASAFMGGVRILMYFTTQSNIWIGVTCLVGLIRMLFLRNRPNNKFYLIIKYTFTVSIALTGIVYCGLLASMIDNAWALPQVLLHVVCPIASVADCFVSDAKLLSALPYRISLYAIIPPAYYGIFAGAGFIFNWDFSGGKNYPYFFLNWNSPAGAFGFSSEPAYIGVVYWVLVIAAVVILFSQFMLWISKRIRK